MAPGAVTIPSPNINQTDAHSRTKERQAIPWMQSQAGKVGLSVKTERVSREMQSTEANDVYSEPHGPKPGRALAIPLNPLEKGASFNLWRIEVTANSVNEVVVEERTEYRKHWTKVLKGRLASNFHGVPSIPVLKITVRINL